MCESACRVGGAPRGAPQSPAPGAGPGGARRPQGLRCCSSRRCVPAPQTGSSLGSWLPFLRLWVTEGKPENPGSGGMGTRDGRIFPPEICA